MRSTKRPLRNIKFPLLLAKTDIDPDGGVLASGVGKVVISLVPEPVIDKPLLAVEGEGVVVVLALPCDGLSVALADCAITETVAMLKAHRATRATRRNRATLADMISR